MPTTTAGVVILGAGSGGYAAAIRAAELGKSVVLVEEQQVGGTCLHRGCIPTKALLRAAEVAESVQFAASMGVTATFEGVDAQKLHQFKDGLVARLHRGLRGLIDAHGITVVDGHGTFIGPRTVAVGNDLFTGDSVVLATGSRSKAPRGIDLSDRILTSDRALEYPTVPGSAVILGGGVIGVEFATIWSSLGCEVTIVEALPRLLGNEEEALGKLLERSLRRRKITVKTSAEVVAVDEHPDSITVTLSSGDTYTAEIVLAATGRAPNTEELDRHARDLHVVGGHVVTDSRLRTSIPDVYAVGDIVAGPQLAHRGFQHGIFVAEQLSGLEPAVIDDAGIPRVTYSHPEVAAVGLSEQDARAKFGDDVEVVTYDLAGNGRSQMLKTSGFVKVIARRSGPVVGVHMIGDRVSELIGEAQLLYNLQIPPERVSNLIHAHPTQGEAIGEALLALSGKGLHAPS